MTLEGLSSVCPKLAPPTSKNNEILKIFIKNLTLHALVFQWTIPLKEAASLLWYFYHDPLRSLTLLSLNVLSQKS